MEFVQCLQNENRGVTVYETLNSIVNAGYKSVFIQWYNKDDWFVSQEEQLEMCKNLGLNIQFFHLGYSNINSLWLEGDLGDQVVEGYLKDLDTCKKYNINLAILHFASGKDAPPPNEIGLTRFKKIIDYANTLNIKIALENTRNLGHAEYVFDNISADNLGLCFDTGHYHTFFKDDFDFEKFKGKVFAIHIHDNDASGDLHQLPFDGTIDWNDLMLKIKRTGYSGPITMESIYSNKYRSEVSLDNFYIKSMERAKELASIFESYN